MGWVLGCGRQKCTQNCLSRNSRGRADGMLVEMRWRRAATHPWQTQGMLYHPLSRTLFNKMLSIPFVSAAHGKEKSR